MAIVTPSRFAIYELIQSHESPIYPECYLLAPVQTGEKFENEMDAQRWIHESGDRQKDYVVLQTFRKT